MKKSLFKAILMATAVIVIGLTGWKTYDKYTSFINPNTLLMANIEALTENDAPTTPTTSCPPNHTPDRYICASVHAFPTTCDRDGSISIGGDIIKGEYKKGQTYNVIVELKNCEGYQRGSCCDQSLVGARIL